MSTPDQPPAEQPLTPVPPTPAAPDPALLAPGFPPMDVTVVPSVPAPPPRKRGRVVGLAIGIVALVVILAGGATAYVLFRPTGDPEAAPSTSRTTATPTKSRTPTPTPSHSTTPAVVFTPFTGNVDDLVLPIPAGASEEQLTVIHSGMSDLDEAVAVWYLSNDAPLRQLLAKSDFVAGGLVTWQQGDDLVWVSVLQFDSPTGADIWEDGAEDLLQRLSNTTHYGGLPGLGTSAHNRWAEYDANGITQIEAVYSKGQFGVFVATNNGTATANEDLIFDVTAKQFQLLPAGA